MAVTVKQVRAAVMLGVDSVGKNKLGQVVIRRGYFYRNGMDADKFAARVSAALTEAGVEFKVVDKGDHWAAFNGGASVAKSSHFYVVVE